jgi:hypothetical protein
MTAGLDEVHGSDPNHDFALDGAVTPWVFPIPGTTGSSSPLNTLARLVNFVGDGPAYADGAA